MVGAAAFVEITKTEESGLDIRRVVAAIETIRGWQTFESGAVGKLDASFDTTKRQWDVQLANVKE